MQLTTSFTVFVQNTWIYGCCRKYNCISWLQCRQKSLHRVTRSGWEWGRAVELVQHWAWTDHCCVPAEARIELRWFFKKKMHMIFCPASMPSSHGVLCSQVLLPASLLLQEHCCLRSSSSLRRWITARSFGFDSNQRWKNHHRAKTSSYILLEMSFPGKCNVLNNSAALYWNMKDLA